MSLILRRSQLAAKEESVEGTAEALAAAQAILAGNIQVTPEVESEERIAVSSSLSPFGRVVGGLSGKLTCEVELKGSGTAGTAPEFGPLLLACGFAQTISAGVSVTYKPASSAIKSYTIAQYLDGKRYLLAGCRGTVKIELESGKPAKLVFEFTGTSFSETDETLLAAVTYQATLPRPFLSASFSLDSYAGVIQKMDIDLGNTVSLRPSANSTGGYLSALITKREPKLMVNPEDVVVATKNWYTLMTAGTQVALTATLGATAGNIVTITAPKVQITAKKPEDRNGIAAQALECVLGRNAGDDELSLVFT